MKIIMRWKRRREAKRALALFDLFEEYFMEVEVPRIREAAKIWDEFYRQNEKNIDPDNPPKGKIFSMKIG